MPALKRSNLYKHTRVQADLLDEVIDADLLFGSHEEEWFGPVEFDTLHFSLKNEAVKVERGRGTAGGVGWTFT